MIRRLLTLLVGMSLSAGASAQTSIELRSSAAVKAGGPVLIGDIADVTGDDAEAIRKTVIEAEPPSRMFDIDVQAVRGALKDVVHWGRTRLRGSTCSVTLTGAEAPGAKKAAKAAPENARPTEVKLSGPDTVRAHAVRALANMYGVGMSDLRLLFEEKDKELLDTPASGRRIDVQPTNSGASSRVGLRTYIFTGDRLEAQRTISVEVLVRRRVVSAVAPISRGAAITAEDFTVSEQWHAPSASIPCTPEQVVGCVARSRINAGQVVTMAAIEAPVVVKKGDIVEVHCLSGSIHLKATRARAMGAGRDGELVTFQLEGSKRTFKARMSGRGSAVMVLDTPDEVEDTTKSVEVHQ